MKERIKLNNVEEVTEFVTYARKCDFEINIQYEHFIFDGKSLVGLMNIDLTRELTVYYNGSNPVFEHIVEKYKVKR